MSPEAKWIPFTADEFIDTRRCKFRWDARLSTGKVVPVVVTDAYEEGRGWLSVKLGGMVPVKTVVGPDADKGELQRYLASIAACPTIELNNPSLVWTAITSCTLRVRNREDQTGATVDLEINDDGRPVACRADRPRLVGKEAIMTPWTGTCTDYRDWEGICVARHLEVSWQLPEGPFSYFRAEVTSFTALR